MHCLLLTILTIAPLQHPQWHDVKTESNSSFRSVVTDGAGFICVTGTRLPQTAEELGKAAVICSEDGGRTWVDRTPHQVAVADYRCVSMPHAHRLVIASAGSPAVILCSADRGVTWQLAYKNDRPEAFIDSVYFRDEKNGIAFGDPIDGQFLLLATSDGGLHWKPLACSIEPRQGEAGFAASNGLIACPDANTIVVGLGGGAADGPLLESRVLRSSDGGTTWQTYKVPCMVAGPSQGIFGISIRDDGLGIAVGGDYKAPNAFEGNIAVTTDGGVTWRLPAGKKPSGFRSAVVYVPANATKVNSASRQDDSHGYWLATGPSGTDISRDGEDWKPLSELGYHALVVSSSTAALQQDIAGKQTSIIATGSEGRVAVLAGSR